jgi:sugar-specific transcriptional regulator TrmB
MKTLTEQIDDLTKFLKLVGLNLYESKVYLAILMNGGLLKSKVYEAAGIPQPRVYDTIKSLTQKGFIREDANSGILFAKAPNEVIKNETLESFKRKLQTEKQLYSEKLAIIEERLSLLENKDKILAALENLAKEYELSNEEKLANELISLFLNARKEVLNADKPPIIRFPSRIFDAVKRALANGVNYKRILSLNYVLGEGLEYLENDRAHGVRIKVLDDEKISDQFFVFDEVKVFMKILPTNVHSHTRGYKYSAMTIENPTMAKAMANYFNVLWSLGVPIENYIEKVRTYSRNDLTKIQEAVCKYLLEKGRSSINELTKGLDLDASDVLKALKALVKRGLVSVSDFPNTFQLTSLYFSIS